MDFREDLDHINSNVEKINTFHKHFVYNWRRSNLAIFVKFANKERSSSKKLIESLWRVIGRIENDL